MDEASSQVLCDFGLSLPVIPNGRWRLFPVKEHQDPPATAHLRTVAQLASETGHAEIAAWVIETRAWLAVTAEDYRQVRSRGRWPAG